MLEKFTGVGNLMPRSLYGDVDAISVKRSPAYMYICGQMKLIGQVLGGGIGVSYVLPGSRN
jgi:hypothetical protein